MPTPRKPLMLRIPIFRRRWFGKRELCAIPDLPEPPKATTLVKSQKRLRHPAPRQIPPFLLLGADEERTAKVTMFRREVRS